MFSKFHAHSSLDLLCSIRFKILRLILLRVPYAINAGFQERGCDPILSTAKADCAV